MAKVKGEGGANACVADLHICFGITGTVRFTTVFNDGGIGPQLFDPAHVIGDSQDVCQVNDVGL